MSTAVVLFTRDLRVHDHPALHAACRADRVVPLFVLDTDILSSSFAAPNRIAFLLDSLTDLRRCLRARGGELVVRNGDAIEQVGRVCREVAATAIHVSADVSRYARRRQDRLRSLASNLSIELRLHPGVTVVAPGDLVTSAGSHYQVFGAYRRRWDVHEHRRPRPAPARVTTPGITAGAIPPLADVVDGSRSPELLPAGESAARERADAWATGGMADYERGRDDLGRDRTSRLSPYLHFGCLSPGELAARADPHDPGHEAFLSQLCWRDYNHQLTAAVEDIANTSIRPRGDVWRDDEDAIAAWKGGTTGYPIVDAGMRQLVTQGWMHNRARMITASFLSKHLYVDWRVGARHFLDWLVDGDIANNSAQWQWIAGVGTDTRPNRLLNPVRQSRRFDPSGDYIRRHVPEVAALGPDEIHEPWRFDHGLGYPPPIVDLDRARDRFLAARGAASAR